MQVYQADCTALNIQTLTLIRSEGFPDRVNDRINNPPLTQTEDSLCGCGCRTRGEQTHVSASQQEEDGPDVTLTKITKPDTIIQLLNCGNKVHTFLITSLEKLFFCSAGDKITQ